MRFKLGEKVRVKHIPEGTKSKDNTLRMWDFMTKYCGKEYEIVDFYQGNHYVLSNAYIFPEEWLELAEEPKYILGNELTQKQVNALPDGVKIFVKEPEGSVITDCIYTIKDDKLRDENDEWIFKSKLEEHKETAYEVCVFDDMQEVTTRKELFSLPDGTYVFAYEERDSGLDSCLCIKQKDRVNDLYKDDGYIIEDLEFYQWRGVRFYVDKNIKLQTQVETETETETIEIKIKDDCMSIDIDENYHVHTCFDVNDESDKLEAMSRLLKNLSEEFEQRSKMVKYEEFTPSQWANFLNGEIVVKCVSEEKAEEFLGILHNMGYTWASGRSLIECTNYSNDKVYVFNYGVRWDTVDCTEKPIFLYK